MSAGIHFLQVAALVVLPAIGGIAITIGAAREKKSKCLRQYGYFTFLGSATVLSFTALWLLLHPFQITVSPVWYQDFQKHYFVDNFSFGWSFAVGLFLLLSGVLVKYEFELSDTLEEMLALLLFAASGAMLLVTASSLLMVFVGLEFMSLPTYVLVASKRGDAQSCEAGLKYFLFGAFGSVLLLLSSALLYAVTGSIYFADIERSLLTTEPKFLVLGITLFMGAVGFKLAVAPFHMWLPDVYQGAPPSITAFMGSAVKMAGFALALRVLWGPLLSHRALWTSALEWLAVLAMVVGSLAGLAQRNLKRLLAYSSISHAGYLALGVAVVPVNLDSATLWYYLITYGTMFIGFFAVIACLEHSSMNCDIDALAGLGFSRPMVGLSLVVFVLSAAGIPPLAGFVAKYFLFFGVVRSGHSLSVLCAALTSVISLGYYLRLIVMLYMREPSRAVALVIPKAVTVVIWFCALSLVYLGIFPTVLT